MRLLAWLTVTLVLAFAVPTPAQAYRFGNDDTIHKIEDVKLKGAKDETLFLGYMTRVHNFIAPVYLEDLGYVLGVEGDSKSFYHMPTGDELARFQRNGLLPSQFPPYTISTLDYVMGYALWWGLALGALFMAIGALRKKRQAPAPTVPDGGPIPAGAQPPSTPQPGAGP